jgi:hypothetical protein
MGTYRNPDAVVANTGSAVYEGIQKLAGDVYTFAVGEQARKAKIIESSLKDSQAVDDNITKIGNTGELSTINDGLVKQAEDVKTKINDQYLIMAKTFVSAEEIAKAKAEIARLNKFPEQLTGDLTTTTYLVQQYREKLKKGVGVAGAISFTNDINMLGVVKDLVKGGENTVVEAGKNNSRILKTTIDGEVFELNVTSITNGIKADPDYTIFKEVVDDQGTSDTAFNLFFGDSANKVDLIANKVLIKEESASSKKIAGSKIVKYEVDDARVKPRVRNYFLKQLNTPEQYTYMNSVWQDKMGNEDSLSEALEKDKKDKTSKVLDKITDHYLTISKRKLSTKIQGFSLQDATPAAKGTTKDKSKPSKRAKFISAQLKTAKGLDTNTHVQVGDDFRVVRTGDKEWTLQEAVVQGAETVYKPKLTVDDPALLRGQFGEEDASLVLTAEQQNQVNTAMDQI